MSQRHRRHSSDIRLSRDKSDNESGILTDSVATLIDPPDNVSHIRGRSVENHQDKKATEETRVESRINKWQTIRLLGVVEKKPLNQRQRASTTALLDKSIRAATTTVATSARLGSGYDTTEDKQIGYRDTILSDRIPKRYDRRISKRAFRFVPIRHSWSEFRKAFVIASCSTVVLAILLGIANIDIVRNKPSAIDISKTSKSDKQKKEKTGDGVSVKREADLRSDKNTTAVEKRSRDSTPSPEEQSGAATHSSISLERAAVDHLIAGRIPDAYRAYRKLATQRRDEPVYRVISRTLERQIANRCARRFLPGNHICEISESE